MILHLHISQVQMRINKLVIPKLWPHTCSFTIHLLVWIGFTGLSFKSKITIVLLRSSMF